MKRLLLITLSILCLNYAVAQQRSAGQWSVKGGAGVPLSGAWSSLLGAEKNFGITRQSLSLDLINTVKKYKMSDDILRNNNLSLAMQYNYALFNRQWFLVSGGVGFFGGFHLYNTKYVSLATTSEISGGIVANLNLEFMIFDNISVTLSPLIMYDLVQKTEVLGINATNKFTMNFLVGIKYFL